MSNPIALYVGNIKDIKDQINQYKSGDIDEITLDNLLNDPFDTDFWCVDLMQLINKNGNLLKSDVKKFISILSGDDVDSSQDDDMGFNFILSANDIKYKYPDTIKTNGTDIAKILFSKNEFFQSEKELGQFYNIWINALKTAVENDSGVAWLVFI